MSSSLISSKIGNETKANALNRFAAPVAGLLCVFILNLRMSDSFFNPQFWAEDGTLFWYQQAAIGWRSIFLPYAGYYHLVPRLIALVSSLFDQAYAPALFFAAYVGMTYWSASTAASSVSDPRLGLMLGAGLMLPPIGIGEILGTTTNIQWMLAPTLALMLVPAALSANRIAYAGVGALTGPFSIFLAPLAAYRFFQEKDLISAIILGGCAIQLFSVLHGNAPPYPDTPGTVQHLLGVLVFRPFMYNTICTALGFAVLLASLQSDLRVFRLVLIYLAIAVTAGTLSRFLNAPGMLDEEGAGARYFYIPRVVAIWCAMSIAFIDFKNTVLAVAFILSLEFAGLEHLKKAPLADAQWGQHYRAGDSSIQISPSGWTVEIPRR